MHLVIGMIKLEVAKYCENCPEFEADVKKETAKMYAEDSGAYTYCDTVIRCAHAERCANIRKHLLRNFDI